MSLKGKIGALVSRNKKDPADFVFGGAYSIGGYFIFEDGSIGTISEDDDFDIMEFIEIDDDKMYNMIDDYNYDMLDGKEKKIVEDYIKDQFGGKLPIGSIYVDRWYPDGTPYEGGCFICYKGETLGDWCDRNNEPRPIMDAPDEAVEMLEDEDFEGLKKFLVKIPGLKK